MERRQPDLQPRDSELVQRARRGSADAFAELVTRYQGGVYNLCYRLCHDETEALDLAQSAFVKALEGLPRFEARARFSTWLYRISVNLALSQRRSHRRRRTVSLDGLAEREPDERSDKREMSPGEAVERDEMHESIAAALARVEAEFRAAIVLKGIEGLDYAAIAEILQVPIGTVKSRIHRGRTMLRELLTSERVEVASGQA
jgi:RNA polymerase sigma-70 factor (ECF subfamily)